MGFCFVSSAGPRKPPMLLNERKFLLLTLFLREKENKYDQTWLDTPSLTLSDLQEGRFDWTQFKLMLVTYSVSQLTKRGRNIPVRGCN